MRLKATAAVLAITAAVPAAAQEEAAFKDGFMTARFLADDQRVESLDACLDAEAEEDRVRGLWLATANRSRWIERRMGEAMAERIWRCAFYYGTLRTWLRIAEASPDAPPFNAEHAERRIPHMG